jgi:nucleoside-diphosphate kinase
LKTLLIVKPDWVDNRELISELFYLIKENSLSIIHFRRFSFDEIFWKEFYKKHLQTSFFNKLIQYMSSAPSLIIIIEGERAVDIVRWQIIGRKGSGLRGKYQIDELRNVAHASDSEENAGTEIGLVTGIF